MKEYQKLYPMRQNSITLLFFLMLTFFQYNKGYSIDYQNEKEINAIKLYFKSYDSLLFFTQTSYWKPYDEFFVIAFKSNKTYKINGHFKIVRKKIKKLIVLDSKEIDDILTLQELGNKLNLSRISLLDIDSLNNSVDFKTKIRFTITDGSEHIVLVINNTLNTAVYKSSYMTNAYQKRYPNEDRQYYLNALYLLEKIFQWKIVIE